MLPTASIDYELPAGLVAKRPVEPRDSSRLMVIRRSDASRVEHRTFRDLPEYLRRGDVLVVNQGSLYPALHRLDAQGLIAAEWGVSENNRQAKFYELTKEGRRQLADETEYWQRFTSAVGLVLKGG